LAAIRDIRTTGSVTVAFNNQEWITFGMSVQNLQNLTLFTASAMITYRHETNEQSDLPECWQPTVVVVHQMLHPWKLNRQDV
jgi:hypothetical protein